VVNKAGRIGRDGEHYVAEQLRPFFPKARRYKDRRPSQDIKGTPWMVEVKRQKGWAVQQWIRKVNSQHGADGKWMLWVVPRDRRLKDEEPECIVVSVPLLKELLQEYTR